MSADRKERERFVAALKASVNKPETVIEHCARCIMRAAATHGRLAEESCNGHPAQSNPHMDAQRLNRLQERWDARIEREEARMETIISRHAATLGVVADFGGDPRGYTVKLHLPTGAYNTWGGRESGYGVPQ